VIWFTVAAIASASHDDEQQSEVIESGMEKVLFVEPRYECDVFGGHDHI
jgi:hypothetical protein